MPNYLLPIIFIILLTIYYVGYHTGVTIVKQKLCLDRKLLLNAIILAGAGTAAVTQFSPQVATMSLCLFFIFAMCLGADYADFTLPDTCTIAIVVVGLIMSYSTTGLLHGIDANIGGRSFLAAGILPSLGGAAFGFLAMLSLAKLASIMYKKEAMGGGDIKFMAGIGAVFGWQATIYVLVFGAMFGLLLSFAGRFSQTEDKPEIPFGPPMIYAAITWMFGGYHLAHNLTDRINLITSTFLS